MSKNKKDKLDSNVREFLEEMEAAAKIKEQEKKDENSIVCPGCGEKMLNTLKVCTTCGAKLKQWTYTPISDKKAAMIRWISGAILVIGFFLVWFLVINK